MTDNEQLFKLTEMVGTLNANVRALLMANDAATKQREQTAIELVDLKSSVESFTFRLAKAELAADEYAKIKLLGRGYLAGVFAAGIGGGSVMVYFKDHILSFFKA